MEEKEVKIKYKKLKIPFDIDFDKTMEMHDKFIKEFAERTDFVYFQQNKDKFVKLITDLQEENQALKDRWQKLDKWIEKNSNSTDRYCSLTYGFVLDKMQELEKEIK